MLKKGITLVKFTRPASAMRVVLMAVKDGAHTRFTIQRTTGLSREQVESALKNLTFTGAVVRQRRKNKLSLYGLSEGATC